VHALASKLARTKMFLTAHCIVPAFGCFHPHAGQNSPREPRLRAVTSNRFFLLNLAYLLPRGHSLAPTKEEYILAS